MTTLSDLSDAVARVATSVGPSIVGVGRNGDLAANLPVHLDRQLDYVIAEVGWVSNRPWLVSNRRRAAQDRPQLLSHMRRERRQPDREARQLIAREAARLRGQVDQLNHGSDRRVERKPLDIDADLFNRAMKQLGDCVIRRISQAQAAGLLIDHQTPGALQKP